MDYVPYPAHYSFSPPCKKIKMTSVSHFGGKHAHYMCPVVRRHILSNSLPMRICQFTPHPKEHRQEDPRCFLIVNKLDFKFLASVAITSMLKVDAHRRSALTERLYSNKVSSHLTCKVPSNEMNRAISCRGSHATGEPLYKFERRKPDDAQPGLFRGIAQAE